MRTDGQLDNASALMAAGQLDEAIALLGRVCAKKKQDSRALHMFGVANAMKQNHEAAEDLLRKARSLKPNSADILTDLGSILVIRGKHAEAAEVLEKARRRDPRSLLAAFNHGVALAKLGRFEEALAVFDDLASRDPSNISFAQNRATVLGKLLRFEEAEAAVDDILRKQPAMPEALLVKSVAVFNRASFDEALAIIDRLIAAAPEHLEAIHNRAQMRLLTGDLEQGWRDYEARWPSIGPKPRVENVADWNGEPLSGRSLLVHCEQGMGDILNFCRYAKVLTDQGVDVALLSPPRLKAILSTLPSAVRIVDATSPLQDFDFQVPLLSLPLRLKTTVDNIPAGVPYLFADPDRVALWKSRLGPSDGLKIGVSWQGNPKSPDQGRGIPLSAFEPLARHPGVRLISLQTHVGLEQLEMLPAGMSVEALEDFDNGPDAFVDTAAVMASLDLVVTSDTAVGHLAGALGRPTWLALKTVPNWRWMLERTDSPWYPTLKLYRQQRAGDWDDVFTRMAADLAALSG